MEAKQLLEIAEHLGEIKTILQQLSYFGTALLCVLTVKYTLDILHRASGK